MEDGPVAATKTCIRYAAEPADKSGQIDLMFRAFCDRTRLRILSLLRNGELCVGDIVDILEVPQPRVSRHLGHLRKAGLVTARRSGLWMHYSLTKPVNAFHRKLLDCAATCFQDVPEIQADNARAAKTRDGGGCCR
jgi:ArsR family transcriptional regulator